MSGPADERSIVLLADFSMFFSLESFFSRVSLEVFTETSSLFPFFCRPLPSVLLLVRRGSGGVFSIFFHRFFPIIFIVSPGKAVDVERYYYYCGIPRLNPRTWFTVDWWFSLSQKQESFLKPLVDQYAKEGKDKKVVFEANFSKPNCKPKWFFRKDVSVEGICVERNKLFDYLIFFIFISLRNLES